MREFDEGLLTIIEDLIETIELREASAPDTPSWEANARIRRLEAELVERYHVVDSPSADAAPEPALAGVF